MTDSAKQFVQKWTSRMNINTDLFLNLAELGTSVGLTYSIILASIICKSSILVLSIVFVFTLILSFITFKECDSDFLKDGIGLFGISLVNSFSVSGIMWLISNTRNEFKSNNIYVTALILSPILVYIFSKILERSLQCGDHFFILFPLQKILNSPISPILKVSLNKAAKITDKLLPQE